MKKRVETLEGKHSYLEICHTELASRNQKIKIQISSLTDKEKQLENLLIFALKNFAPNFMIKNSDMKYFDNTLPEGQINGNSNINTINTGNTSNPILSQNANANANTSTSTANNQLIEINKSTFHKNDVLNKIFKEIKSLLQYYYIVKETPADANEEDFIPLPILSSVPVPVKYSQAQPVIKKENLEKITGNMNNFQLDTTDYMFNNQMRDFQSKFMNCLEDQNLNLQKMNSGISSSSCLNLNLNLNQTQISSNMTKIYPRRTSSITIIENNADYELIDRSEDIKSESAPKGLFKIMSGATSIGKNSSFSTVVNSVNSLNSVNSVNSSNPIINPAQLLQNKRKRNFNKNSSDIFYDAIHPESDYKLEKKE